MNTTTSIEELAREASGYFQRISRGDDTITTLKDNSPDWVEDLVYEAHVYEAYGDFMPDDWRYTAIERALDHIADTGDEDAHDFADGYVDAYTGARLQWLASNLSRVTYCDDAMEEGLTSLDGGIVACIGLGQYVEALEVYNSVIESLNDRLLWLGDVS